jgi:ferredoxin/flavodoxin---NADP+ reductase
MTPEEIADARLRRYNGTVVALRRCNPDLMILRVRPDFPIPPHQPGQYTTLGLGLWEPRFPGCQDEALGEGGERKVLRRAYSIGCPILADDGQLFDRDAVDWLEFYIVLVRDSGDPAHAPGLTPRLFMLREGDRLQIGERITGHFTLAGVGPSDSVLFLSTGTGEAPHNYMLWQLLRQSHRGRILAACCVRYRADLGYLDTHERLASSYPLYAYAALVTREGGAKVYVQDLITSGRAEELLGRPLDPATTHVFLCGNPNMIGVPVKDPATGARAYPQPVGVVEILETRYGFRADQPAAKVRGNVHFEEYW